jgi:GNAT superfamily N-acetyltransferase
LTLSIERVPLDDPAATTLVAALFDDLNERYGDEDDGGEGWYAEVTPERVQPPDGVFVVARWDGEPLGCGAVKRIDATTAEVKRMYTAPHGRKKGVARAVLGHLEDEARRLGYTRMRLETGEEQPEAVALYESAGWHRITSYGRYRDDPRSICFEKALATP